MFPLDPSLVWLLKFFVFFTCVAFWAQVAYNALMGRYIRRRHYRFSDTRRRDEDADEAPVKK